ncbi:innexin unc-9-like isoform X1 [Biomphalaria glabrata]|uniref:Innexin n=2 Tax=Biomphalaria glabrata TaxID=6526 RepID=A0A9W2YGA8_BIOGL|nr:innexin unc-9-like isoform X1 [Biomphalaria glabrata]
MTSKGMESFLSKLPNLQIRDKIRVDDTVDQLHHFVTVYLFASFALMIGLKEYAGTPLDCWVTLANFKHFQDHVNSYCWTHRLYRYPDKHNLSKVPYELDSDGGPQNTTLLHNSETVGQINFYRWITVIFLVQALLFKLPNLVWNICNEYSGTQIEKMVTMIADSSFDSKEKKATTFSSVAEYLETWLKINRKPFWFMKNRVTQQSKKILRYWMICLGANTRNYLSTMYLVIKAAFLLNVVLQFIMLTAFLDFNYWHYGAKALEIYHKTRSTQDRTHFPRVALCHFQVRGSGHWIQCLLTINMLLEKLLIVEWFWLMVLLCITIYSLFNWLARILRTGQSVKFIVKYLSVFNDDGTLPQDGKRTVLTFVRDYLGNDGVFMLRILALNTNDVVMSELICSVWKRYIDYNNTSSGKEDPEKAPEPSCDITMDDVELKPLTSNDKLNDELHIQ